MMHTENDSLGDDIEPSYAPSGVKWAMAAAVTALNAITSTGFAIAGLLAPDHGVLGAGDMYAAARAFPLAITVLVLIAKRSWRGLGLLGAVLALVQACDALVGFALHDVGKTVGPLVLSAATLAAVRPLLFVPARKRPS